jgi:hypothetical protein
MSVEKRTEELKKELLDNYKGPHHEPSLFFIKKIAELELKIEELEQKQINTDHKLDLHGID